MGEHHFARTGWTRSVMLALPALALAACTLDSSVAHPYEAPGQSLGRIQQRAPGLRALLQSPARGLAERVAPHDHGVAFRVSAWRRPRPAPGWMTQAEAQAWQSAMSRAGYGLRADLPPGANGRISVHASRMPGPVHVRRLSAVASSGELLDSAVLYPRAAPGLDSMLFAREGAIEELLIVNTREAIAGYQLELPAAIHLRQAGPFSAEFRDDAERALLRFAARRGWDAQGVEFTPRLVVNGSTLVLKVPESVALPAVVDPSWEATDLMSEERASHVSALLPTGDVLVAGGCTDGIELPQDGGEPILQRCTGANSSAELYNPLRGEFTATGELTVPRHSASVAVLRNGKVLVVGGCENHNCKNANDAAGQGSEALSTAELYDPATRLFTPTGSLAQRRMEATATLLSDGKVLVVGGLSAGQDEAHLVASAELYDPATGTFTPAGTMSHPRVRHTATLLGSGRVLIAGGMSGGAVASSTAELYDPYDQSFTPLSMKQARCMHSATRMYDGKVLLAGGCGGGCGVPECSSPSSSAELYDEASGSFLDAPSMLTAHYDAAATLLPSGRVLIAGGCALPYCGMEGAVNSSEEFDPATQTFLPGKSTSVIRHGGTATVLHTGRVLMAGGRGLSSPLPSAELYDTLSDEPKVPAATLVPMVSARLAHSATLLGTGEVLLAGGLVCTDSAILCLNLAAEAELFDPAGDQFKNAGSMHAPRLGHTATLLPSGDVLMAGGCLNPLCGVLGPGALATGESSAELYDTKTGTFRATKGPMSSGRVGHSATMLPNGKVLLAAGCGDLGCSEDANGFASTVELYDPDTEQFTPQPQALSRLRGRHTATLLESGLVALVGGRDFYGSVLTTELLDSVSGARSAVNGPWVARTGHAASLGARGDILLAGGMTAAGTTDITASAEHYRASAQGSQSAPTGAMSVSRFWVSPGQAELLSGAVRMIGSCSRWDGCSPGQKTSNEDFEPMAFYGAGEFRTATPLAVPRTGHTVTRLLSGDILVTGGCDIDAQSIAHPMDQLCNGPVHSTAELLPAASTGVAAEAPRAKLLPLPAPVVAGQAVSLSGSGFTGWAGSGSGRSSDSPSNVPVAVWFPDTGGYPLTGTVGDWTDLSASWSVPLSSRLGPGWVHLVVQGIASQAIPVVVRGIPTGQPCLDGVHARCASGTCKDGYCCDSACSGECQVCSAAKGAGNGTCGPAAKGAACTWESAEGCNGVCDGQGHCEPRQSCAPGVCNQDRTGCTYECTADHECDPSAFCQEGRVCASRKGDGESCAADMNCVSGRCVTGVCCRLGDAADCGNYACEPGTGACLTRCQGARDCRPGTWCDPESRCLPAEQTGCFGAFVSHADGGLTACAPYLCAHGACKTSCTAQAQCAPGFTCDRPLQRCVPIDEPEPESLGCACTAAAMRSHGRSAAVGIALWLCAMCRRLRRSTSVSRVSEHPTKTRARAGARALRARPS